MGQSELIEIAIGVVFVWFLLSMVLSGINEGLALLFRIRAKHLWLAIGRVVRPAESRFARRFLDTAFRLPFKPTDLDQRPLARDETADPAVTTIQAHPPEQEPTSIEAELQRLYDVAAPMLTDVAAVGRRSKLTAIPAKTFSEAIATLASRVHPADLDRAAAELDWEPGRIAALSAVTSALPSGQPIDVRVVSDMNLGDVSKADKHRLFLQATQSLTPQDLLDYFESNPGLRAAIARAIDTVDASERLATARATVEQWYDREMDRLSAHYRRQNRKVLLVLSIPIVLFFQANTISTVDDLSQDAGLREAMTNAAVAASENSSVADAIAKQCAPATTTTSTSPPSPTTSTTSTASTTVDAGQTPTEESTQDQGSPPTDSSTTTTADPLTEAAEQFRCVADIVQSARTFKLTPTLDDVLHPGQWSLRGMWHWIVDDYGWLGRAFTVVALMFGAQFWFDILRRLVGIRSKLSSDQSPTG